MTIEQRKADMTFGHLQLRLQTTSVNHQVRDKTLGMEATLDRPASSTNAKAEHGMNRTPKAKTTQPAQPPLQKVTYEPYWFPPAVRRSPTSQPAAEAYGTSSKLTLSLNVAHHSERVVPTSRF